MVYTQVLRLKTRGDTEVIDLTERVATVVKQSRVRNGIAVVYVQHTTAAVTTSEYESALVQDLKAAFERLVSERADYQHNHEYDDNGHAHIRASLLGPSVTVPVADGELTLGQWQQIVLLDFDNEPRERNVRVQIVGE